MRIDVKVNADFFLEGGFEFCSSGFNKLTHPSRFAGLRRPGWGSLSSAFVVLLAVGDEDVVVISFNDA